MRFGFGISADVAWQTNTGGSGPPPPAPNGIALENSSGVIELENASGIIELEAD